MSEEVSQSEVVSTKVEVTSNEELSGNGLEIKNTPSAEDEHKPTPPTSTETVAAEESKKQEPSESTIAVPAKPKYRHDWYQTASDVCVNVMIKKLTKDQVKIQFGDTMLKVSIDLGGDLYSLNLTLAHPVDPQKCSYKVLGTKVELKLRKREMIHWSGLESSEVSKAPAAVSNTVPTDKDVRKYPSSAHYTRNWDKIEADVKKEEKEEKPEGDAALNKLFQQIYTDGSDEVKKAMNKSFQESGGTVLSTNWGEIGHGKVDRKPPDGMEWKEYEK